jgi:hypothetical protein
VPAGLGEQVGDLAALALVVPTEGSSPSEAGR